MAQKRRCGASMGKRKKPLWRNLPFLCVIAIVELQVVPTSELPTFPLDTSPCFHREHFFNYS